MLNVLQGFPYSMTIAKSSINDWLESGSGCWSSSLKEHLLGLQKALMALCNVTRSTHLLSSPMTRARKRQALPRSSVSDSGCHEIAKYYRSTTKAHAQVLEDLRVQDSALHPTLQRLKQIITVAMCYLRHCLLQWLLKGADARSCPLVHFCWCGRNT